MAKFKSGIFITDGNFVMKIVAVGDKYYTLEFLDESVIQSPISVVDKTCEKCPTTYKYVYTHDDNGDVMRAKINE